MKQRKRVTAICFALLLFGFIMLSSFFIVENAHHDCVGEECQICMEIEAAVRTISNLKIVPVLAFGLVVLCAFAQICAEILDSGCTKDTLVTLKVELLN